MTIWCNGLCDEWVLAKNTRILKIDLKNWGFCLKKIKRQSRKLTINFEEKLNSALEYLSHEKRKQNDDKYPGETVCLLFVVSSDTFERKKIILISLKLHSIVNSELNN